MGARLSAATVDNRATGQVAPQGCIAFHKTVQVHDVIERFPGIT